MSARRTLSTNSVGPIVVAVGDTLVVSAPIHPANGRSASVVCSGKSLQQVARVVTEHGATPAPGDAATVTFELLAVAVGSAEVKLERWVLGRADGLNRWRVSVR